MDTYFHIGAAKTGSSTLQQSLYSSAPYLETLGVLYPAFASRNHKIFATQIKPAPSLPRHMGNLREQARADRRFAAYLKALKAVIAEKRPRALILSSETMSVQTTPEYAYRLRQAFDTLNTTPTFVLYIRRPSERYISVMQHHLIASHRVKTPQPWNYRASIETYRALFGRDRVNPHLFHPSALFNSDVVADFCHRYLTSLGVDDSRLVRAQRAAITLSAESMTIMQAFRRDFYFDDENNFTPDSFELRTLLRKADATLGAPRPRLRPAIADTVDYGSTNPLWLRDNFNIVFPDFDYARLEKGRLCSPQKNKKLTIKSIVFVNNELREKILSFLKETDWARDKRRAWLDGLSREQTVEHITA